MAETTEVKGWELVQNIPALVSSVGTVSLLLSLAYELGFLLAIDSRLIGLFSIQDAITGALNFLPFAAFGAALRYCHMEVSPLTASFLPQSKWFYRLMLLSSLLLIVLSSARFFGLTMVSLCLLNLVNLDRANKALQITVLLMAVFAAAFGWGGHRATTELHGKDTPFTIDGDAFQILTSGADVLVVRDNPGHIVVLPRSEVKRIERSVSTPTPWVDLPALLRWAREQVPAATKLSSP